MEIWNDLAPDQVTVSTDLDFSRRTARAPVSERQLGRFRFDAFLAAGDTFLIVCGENAPGDKKHPADRLARP